MSTTLFNWLDMMAMIFVNRDIGYFKDKNTGQIEIVEDAAEAVRLIFSLYVSGHGYKAIARILTEKGFDTPSTVQQRLIGKRRGYNWPEICHRNIWIYTQVKRILQDEFYTGTLVNHKSESSSINKTFRFTSPEEQIRHENFVPAIVSREQWEQSRFILAERKTRNVRAAPNKPIHRYTGLIKCRDCGSVFVAKRRFWRDKPERIEYTCNGYHRYGKQVCTSHRINEDVIDGLIYDELRSVKRQAESNWAAIDGFNREWSSRKSDTARQIQRLRDNADALERDIEGILMERIRDKQNAERYDWMLFKRETDIAGVNEQIKNLLDIDAAVQRKKSEMKHSIDLMDDIFASGGISEAHLRMIVDKILIAEVEGKLQLEICLKAAFRAHFEIYDEFQNLIDCGVELHYGSALDEEVFEPCLELRTVHAPYFAVV